MLRNAILLGLVFISRLACSQGFLTVEGSDIVNSDGESFLLRGMGLGGWMVQEGYMLQTASFANPQHQIRATIEDLIGEAATEAFYEAWLANHVRKADIDSLKSWGFNSVRVPLHYNLFTLPIEDEPVAGENTWLDVGFALTDSVVAWCAQNEMYVILDLHAAPGGQGYDAGISDYDSSKPSLWESSENRDKMVALWQRIASHYADEVWVAGYDLLNEPNWNLPGGSALRNLYEEVTDSIRAVDSDHILFIEGNWFANDFTGLTPPWDDKLVYSPHKYWSTNDVGSMQFALNLREDHGAPLYLGESGENSNVWFRDAIDLLEGLNIGWAWWPMKKIDNIAGPLSITKTEAYQGLLDYWSGSGTAPDPEAAVATLMELTENLRIEDCTFHPDVVDAMFRQVATEENETLPFKEIHAIPGVIPATDFDLGALGVAYWDADVANYHVSTGQYTTWNRGWSYRNDGVDIEPCADPDSPNGFNVGWTADEEWLGYTVDVSSSGLYDIGCRVASELGSGRLRLVQDNVPVGPWLDVPNTGGNGNWQTLWLEGALLVAGESNLRIEMEQGGFNLGFLDCTFTGTTLEEMDLDFLTAQTLDPEHVELFVNKPMAFPNNPSASQFQLQGDGESLLIAGVDSDPANPQRLIFTVAEAMTAGQQLTLSHLGSGITGVNGEVLALFEEEPVQNNLNFRFDIPGWIEAEDFVRQEGVELEVTTDMGDGQNVGYLDPGDFMEYDVRVDHSGTYDIAFRTASAQNGGAITMELVQSDGSSSFVCAPVFPPTGGWQSWQTTTETAELDSGVFTLRVEITEAPFNLNWMKFESEEITELPFQFPFQTVVAYPNPCFDEVNLAFSLIFRQDLTLSVFDVSGRPVWGKQFEDVSSFSENIPLDGWAQGMYHVFVVREDGTVNRGVFVKVSH